MRKTCVFVFARGGSKGLPRKNLLPIRGLPLVAHSIRMAQLLGDTEGIYVSTDCREIASIALAAGAEVIERPAELASDTAPEWLAWQHAIRWVEARRGSFDCFLSLPPTAPCRSVADVRRCLDALAPNIDLVLTMTPSHRSPWFNMVIERSDGCLDLVNAGNRIVRRQDSPTCFDITTAAYAAHPAFIMKSSGIWDGKIRGVEIPPERAIDIDTPADFAIARFLKEQYLPDSIETKEA
ncbi:MAG: acylneuraminate cytidylyltransferase family protein [Vulcanococcus sp.]|uniref:acylneuraminate cytidylyltransferase family protein n=1 Tax=Vulcanococcus sp. TaxID=2856995 RepID=UPI0025DC52B4|nr:acylneuraminate cytidylyltransferase family protein [Vulcanococcus sp.]MBW0180973.1 acylneuraminate cytidylyltransferase family protein [Vulcanococcus sp.]